MIEKAMGRKTRKTKGTTSSRRLKDRLKAKQALDYRLEGKSYPDISDLLSYSGPGAAFNAIQRLLKHHEMDSVDELRQVESARLDELLAGLWAEAQTGTKAAVEVVLKIMARRAKLLGLDVPAEIHWKGEMKVKHVLLLKMGDRPPRVINLDDPNWDEALTLEELTMVREMPILEGEVRQLPAGKGKTDAVEAE